MNKQNKLALLTCLIVIASPFSAAFADEHEEASARLELDHLLRLAAVGEVRVSPEGDWIAYTVSRDDLEEDESSSRVWMVAAGGGTPVAMTTEEESSWHPRWSPDGRYLAFLSARDDGKTQVWRLYRGGGEAEALTDTAQSVRTFEWSPDSSRMLLLLKDASEEELAAKEEGDDHEEPTPKPHVIDRYQFKTDYVGYLDRRRTHIHLLDLASGEVEQLTDGDYDDSEPTWSPDGGRIAFTSNRTEEPDLNYNSDIWVVETEGEGRGTIHRVTDNPGADEAPAWSPDGKQIAHNTVTDVAAMFYATRHLALTPAGGGATRLLGAELDRWIYHPRFAPDGRSVWFLLEDAGEQNLARIGVDGRGLQRLVKGSDVVSEFDFMGDGNLALLLRRPHIPGEIFSFTKKGLSQLTFTNRELLEGLEFGEVEKVRFASSDGTPLEAFVTRPPDFREGVRYPVILDIHGGPQSQYDWSWAGEAQWWAANGYLVVQPNPRGSTGYGQEFCLAIWQNWGGPDHEDVMAAVDHVIEKGWGDPERLAVTGWSYGGILTNHVITKTDRFKAAVTGASATLYAANYGHDMYQRWWDREFGLPWEPEGRAVYEKLSPFNQLGRVVTPTLVMGGELDWNVPILNSEQLYIALKKLGVETQLVVYPGEYHGGFSPSHEKDRYERYLAWFDRYLKDGESPP